MRKPVLIIFTNALILVVVFMLLAQSLFVVQRLAQAQGVHGLVEVQRQGRGDFKPLAQGATVAVGDVVRTGSDGEAEFAWADRTRWTLAPQTTLTIQKAALNSMKRVETAHFRLDAGKVFVRAVKFLAPASTFEVETPTAVAAVHGTVFSIAAQQGQTQVEVWKGDLQLTDMGGGTTSTVQSGEAAVAGDGKVEVASAKSDAQVPPDLLHPQVEAIIQAGAKNNAVLRGSTEVGDTVQIDGQSVPVIGTGAFFKMVRLKPGHNQWTIVATDRHGESTTLCRAVKFDAAHEKINDDACAAK